MAIFNDNGAGEVAVEGLQVQPQPVNQELLDKLSGLADMLDAAFEMDGLTGVGDRAIIYLMAAVTISLDSIRDVAEVEMQLAEIADEINTHGATAPGGIDENWWDTFKINVSAARNCLI